MLNRYRVLDLSDQQGWLAGRILADLGAEVNKIEPPGADLSGAGWRAGNINKHLVELDFADPKGMVQLDGLIADADILIETATPGSTLAEQLSPTRLAAFNPDLIQVSITPFGRTGPRSTWRASDIEMMAASGALSLAGERDGTPLRVSIPQSYSWGAANAAVGALVALCHRGRGGAGQHVDVSIQASIIAGIAHAPTFVDLLGETPTRAGSRITGRSVHGADFTAFWPCADGYLNFVLYGGPAGRRTVKALTAWMVERDADIGPLAEIDWDNFDPKFLTRDNIESLEAPIAKFFLNVSKMEFLEEACAREMLGYPVSTVADIAADPQLDAREFWSDLETPGGKIERHCGTFYLLDAKRPKVHNFADAQEKPPSRTTSTHDKSTAAMAGAQALSDLKVVEFGGYAAGPHIGKVLANFGATTVHVESNKRPDGFRLEYPPFKDGKAGVNRGGCFAFFNDSKYGVTLDLKNSQGLELARRLMSWADVVVENMRPGVMERLGLGYEAASRDNPGLIMLSTCNMGQTGPRAQTPGFGSQLSSLAGFYGAIGEADGPPMLLYGPYIDFVASIMGASAALAGYDWARRKRKGGWIDISQYETGLHFIAGALLDYHRDGIVANRRGNHDDDAVPHNAYRCKSGKWLALSCWSDAEFRTLTQVLEQPDLASDARFATAAKRQDFTATLDAELANVLAEREAEATAEILQKAGLTAYPVNDIADLMDDSQLASRNYWRVREHGEIGPQTYGFPGFNLSQTPGDITRAAPLLGVDNEFVFRQLLGLGDDEYATSVRAGAFD